MANGITVLAGAAEVERLHSIAKAAAIQTGAKGGALDALTADITTSLIKQSNKNELSNLRRASLRVVD